MKFLQMMRPLHWTKNMFVFAGLIFGHKLNVPSAIGRAIGGFACFCLAASAVYILNDIIDRQSDRLHPEKCKRPIVSGRVTIGSAVVFAFLCAAAAIIAAFLLGPAFAAIILVYIVLMVLYSLVLRRVMILDCVVIATGFCLRAVAGAVVVNVFISPWLIICTFALCLFMAFGKRRGEIALLQQDRESFRNTLTGYTTELLAHMIDVTSGLAVVCFLLYAMDDRTLQTFGNNHLVYTTPLVLYCIFRFSSLIQTGKYLGPVEFILHDLPFQIGFVVWIIASVVIVYADKLGINFVGIFQ
ncbi:MAG: decaprenyl-phosphate phosphoribosyltransferase [Sedimentisphaerales bacterium]|nr:decaprenyl-phosphate phosphoribosyltransferase [Sedimentisphaerales bacterium]